MCGTSKGVILDFNGTLFFDELFTVARASIKANIDFFVREFGLVNG